MATAKDILSVAQKYIGVEERPNNNVIFNTWYYGHEVSGDQYAWCLVYLMYVFNEAKAKNLLYDGKKTALCQTLADWFKVKGQWFNTPQIGDLVFFKFGSSARYTDHVGIVETINPDGTIGTIEGNTSTKDNRNGGMVMRRVRKSGVVGYGSPKYDSEGKPRPKTYLYKGLDVSAAQRKMDYNKLRQVGVDFAIIKIIRKDLQPDEMFEKHYSGFISAGIPVFAVYNYSYATTVDKAKMDAQVVIKTLAGRKIPVCLDVEDNIQANLGKRLIEIINAYQEVVEAAGLPFLLYTGQAFYNSKIRPWEDQLKCKDLWIARYYKGNTVMPFKEDPDQVKKPFDDLVGWQYTSKGQVDGYDGDLDLDVIYRDIGAPKPSISTQIVTKVKTSGSKLNVRNKPIDGVIVAKLSNGSKVDTIDVDPKTGWYKLGEYRYVSPDYISAPIGIITANSLNIRNADSTKGKVVGIYHKGDTTLLLNQSSTGWYLTPKGWVSNNYVKLC